MPRKDLRDRREWRKGYLARQDPAVLSAKVKAWQDAHPERLAVYRKRHKEKYPERRILRIAQSSAKARGLEFNLTEEDIVIPPICPVLGMVLSYDYGRLYSPSVDRIDNSRGYVRGNIVIVSGRANRLKLDATLEEIQALAAFYKKFM